jgi:DNA-binding transcriptional ArsR family regulator
MPSLGDPAPDTRRSSETPHRVGAEEDNDGSARFGLEHDDRPQTAVMVAPWTPPAGPATASKQSSTAPIGGNSDRATDLDTPADSALVALLATGFLAPAWALYRRIISSGALDSPRRARIMDSIRAQPGITPGALRKATGLHYTSCLHHVRVLADTGFVDLRRVGGQWRCFPREHAGLAAQRWWVASNGLTARALLALVASKPGISPAEAARELGITRSAMQHHTERLRGLGVIEATRAGARVELRIARAQGR